MVKITPNAPQMKLEAGSNPVRPTRNQFSGHDLPADIKQQWADKFVPLWRNYIGTLTDPWDTDNPNIATEMQVCFNGVYPEKKHDIQANDVVDFVVRHIL